MEESPLKQPKNASRMIKAREIIWEIFVPEESNHFLPKVLETKYLFWYGAGLLIVKIALISLALILPSTEIFSAITAERLSVLINQERQARNLSTLTLNNSLNSVASLKVSDMFTQNYFDHTSPAGVTPWHWFGQIGYKFVFAGENLASGFTESDAVFQAWMTSPSHRDNILNPNFQEMGVAVKSGQIQNRADTLAVLVFGKPQMAQKTPKTIETKLAPSASPKTSASPSPKASPLVALNSLGKTPLPSPAIFTPSPGPNLSEQVDLKTASGAQPSKSPVAAQETKVTIRAGYVPRVLGAFTSKTDEIFKSLYLYFTLFLAIALLVNIFVKIRIQHWPTIMATTLVIVLSSVLIFI